MGFIAKYAQAKDPKIFKKAYHPLPFEKPPRMREKVWLDMTQKWRLDQIKLQGIVIKTNKYNATGKDCFNEEFNAKITSDPKKLEQDGYTHYTVWEKREAQCQIDVCKLEYVKPSFKAVPQKCTHFRWAEWGAWNPCEKKKFGECAIKKRTRICMTGESCGEKTKVPDNKCKPYVDLFNPNRTWTNTMSTICDPCPPELRKNK